MDFSLSEEQEMLKTAARGFLEAECPESKVREVEHGTKGYSPKLWKRVADLGWLGLMYPEEYGGMGMNFLDMTVLYEEMGRAMFPSPHLSTVVLCGLTILAAGTDEQKKDILPKIAEGNLILSLAMTEPKAAWDKKAWQPEGITVTATASGNDYVINGAKLFVHDAHVADQLLVVTRTKTAKNPADGITLFLVDRKSPGITINMLVTSAGDNKQSEVIFKNVKVSKKNIVGKLDGGWATLWEVVKKGSILDCAELLGACQRAVELGVDYAKSRMQFDLPIGINQFVQEHAAQLAVDTDSSRRLIYLAAWRLSEGLDCDLEVAMANGWSKDALEDAQWRCHNIMAGVACTEALGVMPLFTKRANTQCLYLGEPGFWRNKIVDELVKLPPPEQTQGKPRGLWDPKKEQISGWDIWADYSRSLHKIEHD